jgi:hypothetical protein
VQSTPPGSSTRELGEDVDRPPARQESERGEQVENGAEARGPARRKCAHVASGISETRPGAALSRALQELARVIETVDVATGLREQVCVSSLAAGHVQHARAGWKAEHVEKSGDFVPVALE